eukprot:651749-Hanusia_phi.AAC.1
MYLEKLELLIEKLKSKVPLEEDRTRDCDEREKAKSKSYSRAGQGRAGQGRAGQGRAHCSKPFRQGGRWQQKSSCPGR